MAERRSVLLLNGPNLNLLGTREPEIYGATTLAEIVEACAAKAGALGLALEARQSNHEGTLIEVYGPRTAGFDLPIVRGPEGVRGGFPSFLSNGMSRVGLPYEALAK